jgi:hypothetical protein
MQRISAGSTPELLVALHAALEPVLPRGMGRTKEQTETWVICHLLATIAESALAFPVVLERGERPDFRLDTHRGLTGVEVTEAVPPIYAKAVAIRNREFPDALVDGSIFSWDSPERSAQEIRDILRRDR